MKVGVIGAGTMGQGIAKAFAQVEGMGCFLSREKPKPKPIFTNN